MQWWFPKYKDWSTDNNNLTDLSSYVEDVLSSKKMETWSLPEEEFLDFLLEKKSENYEKLTEAVYEFWAMKDQKSIRVIVDKNNYYIHHLKELHTIWPQAKYLFLVRDGRDVACSYLDMQKLKTNSPYKPKLPHKMVDIASEWRDNNLRIVHHLKKAVDDSSWMFIKYEDLVSETENTLIDVCSFLDLEYNEEMLTYYKSNRANQDEPKTTLDWKKKTLEKPDADNVGKYMSKLSTEEINQFNTVAFDALENFGYGVE